MNDEEVMDLDEEERVRQEGKRFCVEASELFQKALIQDSGTIEDGDMAGGSNLGSNFIFRILKGLKVRVEGIHVRYEDWCWIDGKVLGFVGLTIKTLTMHAYEGRNDDKGCKSDGAAFKKVEMNRICIYVGSDREEPHGYTGGDNWRDAMRNMTHMDDDENDDLILKKNYIRLKKSYYEGEKEVNEDDVCVRYVLRGLDVATRVCVGGEGERKVDVSLEVDAVRVRVDEVILGALGGMANRFSLMAVKRRFVVHRPGVSPPGNPRAWWMYLKRILYGNSKKKAGWRDFRRELENRISTRSKYVELYGEKLVNVENDAGDKIFDRYQLAYLERDLEYEDIVLFRALTKMQLESKTHQRRTTFRFPTFFFSKNPTSPEVSDPRKIMWNAMDSFSLIHHPPPVHFDHLLITLTVNSCSLLLVDSNTHKNNTLLDITVDLISIKNINRPKKCEASFFIRMGSIRVSSRNGHGMYPDMLFPMSGDDSSVEIEYRMNTTSFDVGSDYELPTCNSLKIVIRKKIIVIDISFWRYIGEMLERVKRNWRMNCDHKYYWYAENVESLRKVMGVDEERRKGSFFGNLILNASIAMPTIVMPSVVDGNIFYARRSKIGDFYDLVFDLGKIDIKSNLAVGSTESKHHLDHCEGEWIPTRVAYEYKNSPERNWLNTHTASFSDIRFGILLSPHNENTIAIDNRHYYTCNDFPLIDKKLSMCDFLIFEWNFLVIMNIKVYATMMRQSDGDEFDGRLTTEDAVDMRFVAPFLDLRLNLWRLSKLLLVMRLIQLGLDGDGRTRKSTDSPNQNTKPDQNHSDTTANFNRKNIAHYLRQILQRLRFDTIFYQDKKNANSNCKKKICNEEENVNRETVISSVIFDGKVEFDGIRLLYTDECNDAPIFVAAVEGLKARYIQFENRNYCIRMRLLNAHLRYGGGRAIFNDGNIIENENINYDGERIIWSGDEREAFVDFFVEMDRACVSEGYIRVKGVISTVEASLSPRDFELFYERFFGPMMNEMKLFSVEDRGGIGAIDSDGGMVHFASKNTILFDIEFSGIKVTLNDQWPENSATLTIDGLYIKAVNEQHSEWFNPSTFHLVFYYKVRIDNLNIIIKNPIYGRKILYIEEKSLLEMEYYSGHFEELAEDGAWDGAWAKKLVLKVYGTYLVMDCRVIANSLVPLAFAWKSAIDKCDNTWTDAIPPPDQSEPVGRNKYHFPKISIQAQLPTVITPVEHETASSSPAIFLSPGLLIVNGNYKKTTCNNKDVCYYEINFSIRGTKMFIRNIFLENTNWNFWEGAQHDTVITENWLVSGVYETDISSTIAEYAHEPKTASQPFFNNFDALVRPLVFAFTTQSIGILSKSIRIFDQISKYSNYNSANGNEIISNTRKKSAIENTTSESLTYCGDRIRIGVGSVSIELMGDGKSGQRPLLGQYVSGIHFSFNRYWINRNGTTNGRECDVSKGYTTIGVIRLTVANFSVLSYGGDAEGPPVQILGSRWTQYVCKDLYLNSDSRSVFVLRVDARIEECHAISSIRVRVEEVVFTFHFAALNIFMDFLSSLLITNFSNYNNTNLQLEEKVNNVSGCELVVVVVVCGVLIEFPCVDGRREGWVPNYVLQTSLLVSMKVDAGPRRGMRFNFRLDGMQAYKYFYAVDGVNRDGGDRHFVSILFPTNLVVSSSKMCTFMDMKISLANTKIHLSNKDLNLLVGIILNLQQFAEDIVGLGAKESVNGEGGDTMGTMKIRVSAFVDEMGVLLMENVDGLNEPFIWFSINNFFCLLDSIKVSNTDRFHLIVEMRFLARHYVDDGGRRGGDGAECDECVWESLVSEWYLVIKHGWGGFLDVNAPRTMNISLSQFGVRSVRRLCGVLEEMMKGHKCRKINYQIETDWRWHYSHQMMRFRDISSLVSEQIQFFLSEEPKCLLINHTGYDIRLFTHSRGRLAKHLQSNDECYLKNSDYNKKNFISILMENFDMMDDVDIANEGIKYHWVRLGGDQGSGSRGGLLLAVEVRRVDPHVKCVTLRSPTRIRNRYDSILYVGGNGKQQCQVHIGGCLDVPFEWLSDTDGSGGIITCDASLRPIFDQRQHCLRLFISDCNNFDVLITNENYCNYTKKFSIQIKHLFLGRIGELLVGDNCGRELDEVVRLCTLNGAYSMMPMELVVRPSFRVTNLLPTKIDLKVMAAVNVEEAGEKKNFQYEFLETEDFVNLTREDKVAISVRLCRDDQWSDFVPVTGPNLKYKIELKNDQNTSNSNSHPSVLLLEYDSIGVSIFCTDCLVNETELAIEWKITTADAPSPSPLHGQHSQSHHGGPANLTPLCLYSKFHLIIDKKKVYPLVTSLLVEKCGNTILNIEYGGVEGECGSGLKVYEGGEIAELGDDGQWKFNFDHLEGRKYDVTIGIGDGVYACARVIISRLGGPLWRTRCIKLVPAVIVCNRSPIDMTIQPYLVSIADEYPKRRYPIANPIRRNSTCNCYFFPVSIFNNSDYRLIFSLELKNVNYNMEFSDEVVLLFDGEDGAAEREAIVNAYVVNERRRFFHLYWYELRYTANGSFGIDCSAFSTISRELQSFPMEVEYGAVDRHCLNFMGYHRLLLVIDDYITSCLYESDDRLISNIDHLKFISPYLVLNETEFSFIFKQIPCRLDPDADPFLPHSLSGFIFPHANDPKSIEIFALLKNQSTTSRKNLISVGKIFNINKKSALSSTLKLGRIPPNGNAQHHHLHVQLMSTPSRKILIRITSTPNDTNPPSPITPDTFIHHRPNCYWWLSKYDKKLICTWKKTNVYLEKLLNRAKIYLKGICVSIVSAVLGHEVVALSVEKVEFQMNRSQCDFVVKCIQIDVPHYRELGSKYNIMLTTSGYGRHNLHEFIAPRSKVAEHNHPIVFPRPSSSSNPTQLANFFSLIAKKSDYDWNLNSLIVNVRPIEIYLDQVVVDHTAIVFRQACVDDGFFNDISFSNKNISNPNKNKYIISNQKTRRTIGTREDGEGGIVTLYPSYDIERNPSVDHVRVSEIDVLISVSANAGIGSGERRVELYFERQLGRLGALMDEYCGLAVKSDPIRWKIFEHLVCKLLPSYCASRITPAVWTEPEGVLEQVKVPALVKSILALMINLKRLPIAISPYTLEKSYIDEEFWNRLRTHYWRGFLVQLKNLLFQMPLVGVPLSFINNLVSSMEDVFQSSHIEEAHFEGGSDSCGLINDGHSDVGVDDKGTIEKLADRTNQLISRGIYTLMNTVVQTGENVSGILELFLQNRPRNCNINFFDPIEIFEDSNNGSSSYYGTKSNRSISNVAGQIVRGLSVLSLQPSLTLTRFITRTVSSCMRQIEKPKLSFYRSPRIPSCPNKKNSKSNRKKFPISITEMGSVCNLIELIASLTHCRYPWNLRSGSAVHWGDYNGRNSIGHYLLDLVVMNRRRGLGLGGEVGQHVAYYELENDDDFFHFALVTDLNLIRFVLKRVQLCDYSHPHGLLNEISIKSSWSDVEILWILPLTSFGFKWPHPTLHDLEDSPSTLLNADHSACKSEHWNVEIVEFKKKSTISLVFQSPRHSQQFSNVLLSLGVKRLQ